MTSAPKRWRERIAGLRLDLTPLRTSRDYRVLFIAGTIFYFGGMMTYVALPFQVYHLTGSNFAVGALGLARCRTPSARSVGRGGPDSSPMRRVCAPRS